MKERKITHKTTLSIWFKKGRKNIIDQEKWQEKKGKKNTDLFEMKLP